MTDEVFRHRVSVAVLPHSFNVIREPLRVVACWRVGDGVFGFDQTFVGIGARKHFRAFYGLRQQHPIAPIALFGHTDVTGDQDYNHDLGAWRARAIYGVLVRDPEIWFEMYGDSPTLPYVQQRLRTTGYAIPKAETGLGPATRDAIAQHIDRLTLLDDAGTYLQLAPTDFLGEHGQFSMQSCSEFNALRRISADLAESLDGMQRSAFERANRRVLAYFFAPGTQVDGYWPCPRLGDGVQACRTRFWSDAKSRRAATAPPRQFEPRGQKVQVFAPVVAAENTFACRFYDRIAHFSPCEKAEPWIPPPDPPPAPPPPPLPPSPPPPPHLDDDHDDDDDPVIPVIPEEPALTYLALNSRDSAYRYNSEFLGKYEGVNRIEIVPEDEAIIDAWVSPEVDATWSLPDGLSEHGSHTHVQIDQVIPAGSPGFFHLGSYSPKVSRVAAAWKGTSLAAEIHAYPFDGYAGDAEKLLKGLHWLLSPAIWGWSIIGDIFADGITVDILDPANCDFTVWGQWREAPVEDAVVAPDYRAFYAYEIVLRGDPIIGASARLLTSLSKLVKKLSKIKKLEKLEEKLPWYVRKALEAVELTVEVAVDLRGAVGVRRTAPDTEETETAIGSLRYTAFARGTGMDLKIFDLSDQHVDLVFTLDASLSLGFGLDAARRALLVRLATGIDTLSLTLDVNGSNVFELASDEGFHIDNIEEWFELP